MPHRPVEEMMPGDVLEARARFPFALVPVSPMVEWHCWHLPLSTDGIIAESLCSAASERLGGVFYRTLPLGLDAFRTDAELEAWGFKAGDRVFGMCFPDVPIASEYCEADHMRAMVGNRLVHLRRSGFRGACLLNCHGGQPQRPTLDAIAQEWERPDFHVTHLSVWQLPILKHELLRIGGHAGLSETHWVLAFRPDLVDLTRVPEGELQVRTTGILHDKPLIEPKYNPRNAMSVVAQQLRESLVSTLVAYMRAEFAAKATAQIAAQGG